MHLPAPHVSFWPVTIQLDSRKTTEMLGFWSTLSLETLMVGYKESHPLLLKYYKYCCGVYDRSKNLIEAPDSPECVTFGHIRQEIPPKHKF